MAKNDSTARAKDQARAAAESAAETAARTGIAAPSTAEVAKARAEGVTEAIKEDAKDAYRYADNGLPAGEPPVNQFLGSDSHSNMIDGMLALGPDELAAAVSDDAPVPMTDDQVANLLKLERNGPNRTLQVKILCERLGVDSPYEVPGAGGPAYTNDVSNVSPVRRPGEDK
jgi:hypothetical protein